MPYTEIPCNNADEFWDYLDPRNPMKANLLPEDSKKLLYRGQAGADWFLLPSSFRQYDFKGDKIISKRTAEKQIEYEFHNIRNFINNDTFIFSLSQEISSVDREDLFDMSNFNNKFRSDLSKWPSNEYYPLVALAQHHKIETCLLDWTSRSYIAAFFAAIPHINSEHQTDYIALWAYLPELTPRINIKRVPLSGDKNMAFQFGYFMIITQDMTFGKKIDIDTLDKISPDNKLWKITLHKRYVPTLLKYCDDHKINTGTIYPSRGLDSVAEACKERQRWEELLGIAKNLSIFNDSSKPI